MKKLSQSIVLLIIVSFLISFPLFDYTVLAKEEAATYRTKDEVVYANLTASGKNDATYVVNVFEVIKAGDIVDYGQYSALKNLTSLDVMDKTDDEVVFSAEKGKFYYQGDLKDAHLPWDFDITYFLNGNEIAPNELKGKDGNVEISIKSSQNKNVDNVFYNNYTLQISFSFDVEHFSNVKAEDGTIVNAGKNEQVTFTVLPEQNADFSVSAHTEDFQMDGIEIAAIPLSMMIEGPDTEEMIKEMNSLTDAISTINNGVSKLNDGAGELKNGANELKNGSNQFQSGLNELDQSSEKLISGSNEIYGALSFIKDELSILESIDLTGLEQLPNSLTDISKAIRELENSLNQLKKAYEKLEEQILAIPSSNISETDIGSLYESNANKETIDKLVESYKAAQTVKETYKFILQTSGLDSISQPIDEIIVAIGETASYFDEMNDYISEAIEMFDPANQIGQLITELSDFVDQYGMFHEGLVTYTDGVRDLTIGFEQLNDGVNELANGTNELSIGTNELFKGTNQLYNLTKDLPKQMTEEIDEMLSAYDKSNFEARSFVSNKNKNIGVVQFIIKTENINDAKEDDSEQVVEEKKGFWSLLKKLFSWKKSN